MAGDLERFLQQAAERLKQKVEQGNAPRPAAPKRPPPVRQAERARQRFEPDAVINDIVEAEVIGSSSSRRELGPDPLSNLDTRQGLAIEIGQSDEKMAGHIHDVFDHDVSNLRRASNALSGGQGQSGKGSQVSKRDRQVSPLIDMLRNPDTLRAAFIASEIFGRKF